MTNALRNPQQQPVARAITLALDDPATLAFLFTRLVERIESGDAIHRLIQGGFDQATIEKLRGMSMSDALRFTRSPCGLALQVDASEVQGNLFRLANAKRLRERLEDFILNGASPRLLTRLFSVTQSDARRMRRQLAPAIAIGGRTREPTDEERHQISQAWERLGSTAPDEVDRVWLLHQEFRSLWISSLELVILPSSHLTLLST